MHDVVKIFQSDGGEIPVLRKILADGAIGVFVETTFPGGVGMGKIALRLQGCRDGFMLNQFFPVVSRERMDALRHRQKKS